MSTLRPAISADLLVIDMATWTGITGGQVIIMMDRANRCSLLTVHVHHDGCVQHTGTSRTLLRLTCKFVKQIAGRQIMNDQLVGHGSPSGLDALALAGHSHVALVPDERWWGHSWGQAEKGEVVRSYGVHAYSY